jgi:hypothetical protein
MKTILTNEDDEKLSTLLREWKMDVPLPPRFQEQVWRHITRAEVHPKPTLRQVFTHWMETTFSRPALAASFVAVLLAAGVTTGYWQAQDRSAQAESRWRTLYVQSIDPYQAPRN